VVWGTVKPRDTVTVKLDGKEVGKFVANPQGNWRGFLPTQNPGGPHAVEATGAATGSQTLSDVYFGDVYICSGQSNMQFSVQGVFNASQEIAKAEKYHQIRVFTVGQGSISHTPLSEFETIEQKWSIASAQSIGNGVWSYQSAVCWFSGRDLYDFNKVPVGLISSNWGGTIIQAWSDPAALKKCGINSQEPLPLEKNVEISNLVSKFSDSVNPNQNSVLYNAMIYPLLPMRIRGVFWYQGENNVGQNTYYQCAFPTMIQSWRENFALTRSALNFFFVQLAAYTQGGPYGANLALLRQSQLAALALPNVGYASAIDLGDLGSPEGNIHPRDKQTVGVRLALAARAIAFNDHVVHQGPYASSFNVLENGPNARIQVNFNASTMGSGFAFRNNACPASLVNSRECAYLTIEGSNRVVYNVTRTPEVKGDSLIISAAIPSGVNVVGTTYAFGDWPVCTIFNKEGFPALPWNFSK